MQTKTLIVGAGPFGLSLAAYLKERDQSFSVTGFSMDYWKNHMPREMYLRSACDWHLDPNDRHTILKFLQEQNLTPADVEPIQLEFYLRYAEWFQQQAGISPVPAWIKKLDHTNGQFIASLYDNETIHAEKVVLAVGLRYFKNIPDPFLTMLPKERYHHTAEIVDFTMLRDRRVLIIGGRQSAFEWAALIHEKNAKEVHLAYRHDTPDFTESDWTWVNPLLESMADNPSWFRNLPQEEKEAITKRMWAEGRLKLEPWLVKRILKDTIYKHPRTYMVDCKELPSGEMKVTLSNNQTLLVDHIVLATGYKMDILRVPMLTNGNIGNILETKNGFPVLDETFQSSIPNLYFTGFAASQDFGPFFGFTAAVRASSKIIGRAIVGSN